MKKITLDITGMHCASCSAVITKALKKLGGIPDVNVNTTTNKATVHYDEKRVALPAMIDAIKKKGYGASASRGTYNFNKESLIRRKEQKTLELQFIISLIFSLITIILPGVISLFWVFGVFLFSGQVLRHLMK